MNKNKITFTELKVFLGTWNKISLLGQSRWRGRWCWGGLSVWLVAVVMHILVAILFRAFQGALRGRFGVTRPHSGFPGLTAGRHGCEDFTELILLFLHRDKNKITVTELKVYPLN